MAVFLNMLLIRKDSDQFVWFNFINSYDATLIGKPFETFRNPLNGIQQISQSDASGYSSQNLECQIEGLYWPTEPYPMDSIKWIVFDG